MHTVTRYSKVTYLAVKICVAAALAYFSVRSQRSSGCSTILWFSKRGNAVFVSHPPYFLLCRKWIRRHELSISCAIDAQDNVCDICHLTCCVYFAYMGDNLASQSQVCQCSPYHYYMVYRDNIQNLFRKTSRSCWLNLIKLTFVMTFNNLQFLWKSWVSGIFWHKHKQSS